MGLELPRQVARPVHGPRQPVAGTHREDGAPRSSGWRAQRISEERGEGIRPAGPCGEIGTGDSVAVDSRESLALRSTAMNRRTQAHLRPCLPSTLPARRSSTPAAEMDRRSCSSRGSASSGTGGRRRSMACASGSRWCRSTIAGSARASTRDGRLTIEDMAADALAIWTPRASTAFHVAGHSMGGVIAQALALRRADAGQEPGVPVHVRQGQGRLERHVCHARDGAAHAHRHARHAAERVPRTDHAGAIPAADRSRSARRHGCTRSSVTTWPSSRRSS